MANSNKVYLGCRIEADVKKDVEALAEKEERSVSKMTEILLREGVLHLKGKKEQAA